MGATLKWKPVRPEGKSLSDAMKYFVGDAYEYSDGNITLAEGDEKFLAGAAAATKDPDLKKDIATILEAIRKYGKVEIWQEF